MMTFLANLITDLSKPAKESSEMQIISDHEDEIESWADELSLSSDELVDLIRRGSIIYGMAAAFAEDAGVRPIEESRFREFREMAIRKAIAIEKTKASRKGQSNKSIIDDVNECFTVYDAFRSKFSYAFDW